MSGPQGIGGVAHLSSPDATHVFIERLLKSEGSIEDARALQFSAGIERIHEAGDRIILDWATNHLPECKTEAERLYMQCAITCMRSLVSMLSKQLSAERDRNGER